MWIGIITFAMLGYLLYRALKRIKIVECNVEQIYEKELKKND